MCVKVPWKIVNHVEYNSIHVVLRSPKSRLNRLEHIFSAHLLCATFAITSLISLWIQQIKLPWEHDRAYKSELQTPYWLLEDSWGCKLPSNPFAHCLLPGILIFLGDLLCLSRSLKQESGPEVEYLELMPALIYDADIINGGLTCRSTKLAPKIGQWHDQKYYLANCEF